MYTRKCSTSFESLRRTSLALKARDAYLKVQKYVPFLHRKPAAKRTLLHSKALNPEESGVQFQCSSNRVFKVSVYFYLSLQ